MAGVKYQVRFLSRRSTVVDVILYVSAGGSVDKPVRALSAEIALDRISILSHAVLARLTHDLTPTVAAHFRWEETA